LYESYSLNLALYGTMIFASIRLIPALQQIFFNITLIKFTENIVSDTLNLMDNIKKYKENFKITKNWKKINLINIHIFNGQDDEELINRYDIEIRKNEIIGISGESGAGKTTLLDALFGLRSIRCGKLLIDDLDFDLNNNLINWEEKISYVQNSITLVDGDIYTNIAMSQKLLNEDIIEIDSYLKTFGLNYLSSDLIKQSSNGERQKIGLARALYEKTPVIILDEPTSSMDSKSEQVVISVLDQLRKRKTIIIVSHRQAPLEICDRVYTLLKNNTP
jgi:ABC-type bacteriocin/lantibiotic exporter with double-glycine peptidase domain